MSSTNLCRLCICNHTECRSLFDNFGQENDVYEITVKYFDPMFFNSQQYPQFPMVICMECWHHINDFHTFQRAVHDAQSNLEQELKPIVSNIKIEDDVVLPAAEPTFYAQTPYDSELHPDVFNNLSIKGEDKNKEFPFISKIVGFKDDNTFSTDDENPLINCLSKSERKKRGRKPKKDASTDKNIILVKRTRKSRNKSNTENTSEPKCELNRKLKPKKFKVTDIDNDLSLKLEDKNDCNHSSYDEDDDSCHEFIDSDNHHHHQNDPNASKQKTQEIDAFIAEWKQALQCDLCNKLLTNLTLLRKHFKTEHPKQKFYVSCCHRKLKHRLDIVEHIRYHKDPNSFKCKICDKVSTNSRDLNKHMLNVDRVCDQCGRTLHGYQALKKHLMEHAGIEKPKFRCDECGLELITRNSLKRHKAAYHHDGSTMYVCSICGKVAASENALLNHKKFVHVQERKHKCTYCDKAFKRANNLTEHIAIHTGQDLYQCPHCPQTFKVNANMHHHRKNMHPVEWEESRKNRLKLPKVDIKHVKNQIVL